MSLKSFSLLFLPCASALCLTVPVMHAHLYPRAGGPASGAGQALRVGGVRGSGARGSSGFRRCLPNRWEAKAGSEQNGVRDIEGD